MDTLKNKPVAFGLIGIGAMGKGLFHQSRITPGIRCVALCDLDVNRCLAVLKASGTPHQVASRPDEMEDIIAGGKVAICEDGAWVSRCRSLEVVVEASTGMGNAAEHSLEALAHRKHLVLMNSEIDLMFGPLFVAEAHKSGVVVTSCDGDQPGVLRHLIEETRLWGFDLVMVGNMKGFLDRTANPTSIVAEADKRRLNYRMCTSFTDGSKLNIEMALLANAYDLAVPVVGMTGSQATHVNDAARCFDFERLWKDRRPFVDYLLGAEPGGGVFVVGHCEHPYQRDMLSYYKMGPGPFYVFYRPYHLCHIEAMETIRKAAQEGQTLLSPRFGMKTNVFAYAKKDLTVGEHLDGLGGYALYGQIESLAHDSTAPGLPLCLAEDVVLRRPVPKGQKVLLTDVTVPTERIDFKLYATALQAPILSL
jgi:predicted homoserine dehydrogenase-like protein